jgi:hypothetical protein
LVADRLTNFRQRNISVDSNITITVGLVALVVLTAAWLRLRITQRSSRIAYSTAFERQTADIHEQAAKIELQSAEIERQRVEIADLKQCNAEWAARYDNLARFYNVEVDRNGQERLRYNLLQLRCNELVEENSQNAAGRKVSEADNHALRERLADVEGSCATKSSELEAERLAHNHTEDRRKLLVVEAAQLIGEVEYGRHVQPVVHGQWIAMKVLASELAAVLHSKREAERRQEATRLITESEHVVSTAAAWAKHPPSFEPSRP